jgi:hypothetical protein
MDVEQLQPERVSKSSDSSCSMSGSSPSTPPTITHELPNGDDRRGARDYR